MPKPTITKEAFETLAMRAGLTLTPKQKTELYDAYAYVEAMAERVRAGGKRSPLAEPATIFKAGG